MPRTASSTSASSTRVCNGTRLVGPRRTIFVAIRHGEACIRKDLYRKSKEPEEKSIFLKKTDRLPKKKRKEKKRKHKKKKMASDTQAGVDLMDEMLSWSKLRKSASGDDLTAPQSSTTSCLSSGVISPETNEPNEPNAILLKTQTASRPHAPTPLHITERE